MKLTYDFYNRNVVEVAKDLLGKKLVFGSFRGVITETEAYGGYDDEASHAFKGPTIRSNIMFGPPGYTYVYMIYGIYHCFNVVTDEESQASAVLIRGLKLEEDLHLDGPGKLCRYLGIRKEHTGINIVTSNNCYIEKGITISSYHTTTRIGIKKATNKPWRFII